MRHMCYTRQSGSVMTSAFRQLLHFDCAYLFRADNGLLPSSAPTLKVTTYPFYI